MLCIVTQTRFTLTIEPQLGYDARFSPDDNLFHRSLEVVHLVILGTAIQHVQPVEYMKDTCEHSTTLVFLASLSIIHLMHVIGYVELFLHVEGGVEAVEAAKADALRKFSGAMPVWIGLVLASRDYFSETCEEGSRLPVVLGGLTLFVEQAFQLTQLLHVIPSH